MANRHGRLSVLVEEIDKCHKEIATLKETIRKQGLEILDLDRRLKSAAEIVIQTQPILGRLLAIAVVLNQKGIINESDPRKVEEEHVEMFLASAHAKSTEKVRDKPDSKRTVASNSGSVGSRILRGPGAGGSPESNPQLEDSPRTGDA